MRLASITLLFMIVAVISCEEHDPADLKNRYCVCGVDDPAKDLPWLVDIIDELEGFKGTDIYPYFYVTRADLNGKTVFVIENCCPFCNTIPITYNCNGEELGPVSSFMSLENRTIIWKPEGFQCLL